MPLSGSEYLPGLMVLVFSCHSPFLIAAGVISILLLLAGLLDGHLLGAWGRSGPLTEVLGPELDLI